MTINPALLPADMACSSLKALCHLRDAVEARPCDLARAVGISPDGVTGLLDREENAGLLARHRSPRDRRSLVVALTPKGREFIDGLSAMPETLNPSIPEPLTA